MEFICLNCGSKKIPLNRAKGKYCNTRCQKDYEFKIKVDSWLSGKECGWTGKHVQIKPFLRRWLFETRGAKCEVCGWDKRHPIDDSILLEIDHIDGVATNCTPENLKILCPNCHSMTPTFRRRNLVSSRNRR